MVDEMFCCHQQLLENRYLAQFAIIETQKQKNIA